MINTETKIKTGGKRLDYSIAALVVVFAIWVVYQAITKENTSYKNVAEAVGGLKGDVTTIKSAVGKIQENQESLDGKTAMLIRGLTDRVTSLENKPNEPRRVIIESMVPFEIKNPINARVALKSVSEKVVNDFKAPSVKPLVRPPTKSVPRAPTSLLERAAEMSQ